MLPEVVADLVQAKRVGRRPSEAKQYVECAEFKYFFDRQDSFKCNSDGLLTKMLATGTHHQEHGRIVGSSAQCREHFWDTHKQAHAEAG